jgi:hypothetical protein
MAKQNYFDSLLTKNVRLTTGVSDNKFVYTDSDGDLTVDGNFNDYYDLWLQYYSNGSGSGYPAKMFLIDTLSNFDMDIAEDHTGPHFSIIQRKSRYFYAGNYFSQFRIGSFDRTQKSGKDSIANSNIGLEACFSSYDRSLMGKNAIIYIIDSTGQAIINEKTFHSGSDTYPCLIKGSVAVQNLYSDNKFIYANSAGKLCTTYVKFYGDMTIFPGPINSDSATSGLTLGTLGDAQKWILIEPGNEGSGYLYVTGYDTGGIVIASGDSGVVTIKTQSTVFNRTGDDDSLYIWIQDNEPTTGLKEYWIGLSDTTGYFKIGTFTSEALYIYCRKVHIQDTLHLTLDQIDTTADTLLMISNGYVKKLIFNIKDTSLSGDNGNQHTLFKLKPYFPNIPTGTSDTLILLDAGKPVKRDKQYITWPASQVTGVCTSFTGYDSLYDNTTYRTRVLSYFHINYVDSTIRMSIPGMSGIISGGNVYIRNPNIKSSRITSSFHAGIPQPVITEYPAIEVGIVVPHAGYLAVYGGDALALDAAAAGGIYTIELEYRF